MIHFKEGCVGLTILKWGSLKLELWLAPKNASCREHVHNDSDSEITILYAKRRRIWRKLFNNIVGTPENPIYSSYTTEEYIASSKEYRGQWFSVRHGVPHGFDKGESFMIFLNLQHYLPGRKVTSVAEDFQLTTQ